MWGPSHHDSTIIYQINHEKGGESCISFRTFALEKKRNLFCPTHLEPPQLCPVGVKLDGGEVSEAGAGKRGAPIPDRVSHQYGGAVLCNVGNAHGVVHFIASCLRGAKRRRATQKKVQKKKKEKKTVPVLFRLHQHIITSTEHNNKKNPKQRKHVYIYRTLAS